MWYLPIGMELFSEIWAFVWAVATNWAAWMTGGLIVALTFLWERFKQKDLPRMFVLLLAGVFLVVAFFNAWKEQYEMTKAHDLKGGFLQVEVPTPTNNGLFKVGDTLRFNISFRNKGIAPVSGADALAKLWLIRGAANEKQDTAVFEKFKMMEVEHLRKKTLKGHNVGVGENIWMTVESDTPISQQERNNFL